MNKIYLLTIDYATEYDSNTTVKAYADFEKAKNKWEELVLGVYYDPDYAEVTNPDGSILEEFEDFYESLETREKDELFYEIYQNGYYNNNHYTIKVQKLNVIE